MRAPSSCGRAGAEQGVVRQDAAPCFYVVEERFKAEGKARKRTDLLAALSVKPEHASSCCRHERTLAKPKRIASSC